MINKDCLIINYNNNMKIDTHYSKTICSKLY